MSVIATTLSNSLPDDLCYPVIGAALLDLTAAIAGPAWAPDYERAWSAARDVVEGAMVYARQSHPQ